MTAGDKADVPRTPDSELHKVTRYTILPHITFPLLRQKGPTLTPEEEDYLDLGFRGFNPRLTGSKAQMARGQGKVEERGSTPDSQEMCFEGRGWVQNLPGHALPTSSRGHLLTAQSTAELILGEYTDEDTPLPHDPSSSKH